MSLSCALDRPATPRRGRGIGLILLAVFVLVGYGLLVIGADRASIRTFSLIFASIMLEAMPFMVFGALVGGLVEAFVSSERLTAMLPRRGWITVMLAGGLGVFLPVHKQPPG